MQKFKIDDYMFTYTGAYGKFSTVPVGSIKTVSISPKSWGKSILLIAGEGTTLASIELPQNWAEKTMRWLIDELRKRGKAI